MARRNLKVGAIKDVSGEVNIAAGDIIKNIKTIHQRALTAAEEAAQARKLEGKLLAQGIASLVQNLSAQASEGTESDRPYKGLLPYSLNEAEIFYGRNKAKKDLLAHIKQSPLTVLHAESGAGKSSLLQAGIAAQLIANGHLAVYLRPYHADPVDFIKRMFLPELTQAPALADGSLRDFLRQVCSVLGSKISLYLLLDQFEEFFQLKKEERRPFLDSLADCLHDPSLNVRWVLALRKEALSDLAELESFGITQFKNTYRLNRLSRGEAQEAMIEPARRYGIAFEPALIEHILDTLTTNDEVRPTHLQLICSALTDDLPEEKTLTLAYYTEQEGGTEGILRDYLKRQLEDLPASEQTLAWKVLRALISADRQRALKTYDQLIQELKTSGASKKQIETVLSRLVERRVLFTQTQPAAEEVFELAHDYLIKEIELDPQEQALKAAQELLDQETRTYQRHKTLLTAERLAVIEPYRGDLRYSTESRELLIASQEAVQQEQRAQYRRRRQIMWGGALASFVIVAILAGWALTSANQNVQLAEQVHVAETAKANAEEQEKIARAGELAAESQAAQGTQADVALLLGVEAFREMDTPRTRALLLDYAQTQTMDRGQLLGDFSMDPSGVVFSPDGQIIAFSDWNRVILWDVASDQPVGQPLEAHSYPVSKLAFSPDGKILASGANDLTIILWDMTTYEPIGQPFSTPDEVTSLAFSPDGRVLASGSWGFINLWDVVTQQPLEQLVPDDLFGISVEVTGLIFSSDGKALTIGTCVRNRRIPYSACQSGGIDLWDLSSGEAIEQSFKDGQSDITSMALSPDGKTLATGSYDGTIILWDFEKHTPMKQPLNGNPWEMAHLPREVTTLAFSPLGGILAAGSRGNTVILWDLESGTLIGQPMRVNYVDSVAFSPDGNTLATSGEAITLHDVSEAIKQSTISVGNSIYRIAFNLNQDVLALGSSDGLVVTSLTKPTKYTSISEWGADAIAISSDGKVLASTAGSSVILWDTETGQSIGQPLRGHPDSVSGVAFSPDGKVLASTAGSSIILWDTETGQSISRPLISRPLRGQSYYVTSVAFSPDGKILASGSSDNSIVLWNVETGLPIKQPLSRHTDNVTSVAFSPDGKTLVSGSNDSTIILWDVDTGRPIGQPWNAYTDYVTSVAFRPDGRMLASAGDRTTILLWDIETGRPIWQALNGHSGYVLSVAFSSNGKILASGDADGVIILWDLDLQSLVQKLCQRARRNFTRSEWEQYFPKEEYHLTCPQWPLEPEVTPTP